MDPVREALQQILDNCNDGYSVSHYVVGMWIERVETGGIATIPWLLAPPEQCECHTKAVMTQTWVMSPSSGGYVADAS